jgi:hypothetical protein
MKDGTDFCRRYTLSEEKAKESKAIMDALRAAINCKEVRYKTTLNGKSGLEDLTFRGGYITGRFSDYSQQIDAAAAQRIYDAVLADLANGAGGQEPMTVMGEEYASECTVYVELECEGNGVWLDRIRPDFKELIRVLTDLGLDSETLFQFDPAYAEKYGW